MRIPQEERSYGDFIILGPYRDMLFTEVQLSELRIPKSKSPDADAPFCMTVMLILLHRTSFRIISKKSITIPFVSSSVN